MRSTRRAFLEHAGKVGLGVCASGFVAACARGVDESESAQPAPVVVVGSGAAGIMAATALLEARIPVLMLEAGPLLDAHSYIAYQMETGYEPYATPENMPFQWVRKKQVGGKLSVWGGHSVRFSPGDFIEGGEESRDLVWPIRYEDLEGHYARLERMMGVLGAPEGLDDLPDGEFVGPTTLREGEREMRRYWGPKGVMITPGRYALYPQAMQTSQLGRVPVRRSIALERGEGASEWVENSHRGGLVYFNSLQFVLEVLTPNPLFSLMPMSNVQHVELDPSTNRPRSLTYYDRVEERQRSLRLDALVLAAGSIESAKILLNSASERYPDGLGNASGALGRYLMDHTYAKLTFPYPPEPLPESTDAWIGWGNIEHLGAYIPRFNRRAFPNPPGVRGGYGAQISYVSGQGQATLAAFGQTFPRAENRIQLSGQVTPQGTPIPVILCAFSDEELALRERMIETLTEIWQVGTGRLDPAVRVERLLAGRAVHHVGTCRMGSDAATSMLDGFCESHEVPNLFVVDAGAFVTNPEKNPALTIMALALRSGEYLAERLRAGGP